MINQHIFYMSFLNMHVSPYFYKTLPCMKEFFLCYCQDVMVNRWEALWQGVNIMAGAAVELRPRR